MVIDIHNHISLKSSPYHLPVDEYLKAMDECGVEKAVILGKDYGKLGDQQQSNLPDEETATFVKAHPDRFNGSYVKTLSIMLPSSSISHIPLAVKI